MSEYAGESRQTILNLSTTVDVSKQPMFFGEPLGLSRTDRMRYPIFKRLTDEQNKNFWQPHDINLERDKTQYKDLPEHIKHMVNANISYQTLLDTVQSRATITAFLPWVSCPELERCIQSWAYFEAIHNDSYQWILKNIHLDPSVFFDDILKNTDITTRADAIVRYYDEFIRYSNLVKVFGYDASRDLTLYEHKRLIYRAMASVYALESIRFYVSFSNTFGIAEQGWMIGNADEMKLIQRDEALHVGITLNILKYWPKEDDDFRRIAEEESDTVIKIFQEVVDQEDVFAGYVYQKGVMLGQNRELTRQYLEHLANKRLKSIGLAQVFSNKTNPYGWMSKWIATEEEQKAPQETDLDAYKTSAMNSDVDEAQVMTDF